MNNAKKPDKPKKIPKTANGDSAKSNDPNTWSTFAQAIEGAQTHALDGVGIMLGNGIFGVDLDHSRDAETGKLSALALEIMGRMGSYTEISPSGTGIHILCTGDLPDGKGRHKGDIELYSGGRYFTVTGDALKACGLADGTAAAAGIVREFIDRKSVDPSTKAGTDQTGNDQGNQGKTNKQTNCENRNPDATPGTFVAGRFPPLSDSELIDKARSKPKFDKLWLGNWQGDYVSQSDADMALCDLLAFWTGKDAARMDRLFRLSGLMREKWNEQRGAQKYGEMTIDKAIDSTVNVYDPEGMRARRAAESNAKQINRSQVDSHRGGQRAGQTSAKPDQPNQPDQPDDGLVRFPDDHTDQGNAVAFADAYKDLFCYVDGWGWTYWNGQHWEKNALEQAKCAFMRLCDGMKKKALADVAENNNDPIAMQRLKWALKSRNKKQISDALYLAQPLMLKRAEEFDACESDLNTPGGIVDLRTGTMRASDPKALCTCMTKYSPSNEPCPYWHEFLAYVTGGDAELAEYLQLVAGMASVGAVYYEGLVIAHGTGGNGKSTLFNTLFGVFGSYAGTIAPEVLMSQRNRTEVTGLAVVQGKRYVLAAETEENNKLSESTMKRLASTDQIHARFLYQNEFTFSPTHTLILATNHLPKIHSTDRGTWRRLMTVPFEKRIADDKPVIRNYAKQLQEREGAAILAWIIEGARKFYKANCDIILPDAVLQATKEYQQNEDRIENFLEDCCVKGPGYNVPGSALYGAYRAWAIENNEYVYRNRDFASALASKGYVKRKTTNAQMWDGLALNTSKPISTRCF